VLLRSLMISVAINFNRSASAVRSGIGVQTSGAPRAFGVFFIKYSIHEITHKEKPRHFGPGFDEGADFLLVVVTRVREGRIQRRVRIDSPADGNDTIADFQKGAP
jgi:hypothetical protein